MSLILLQHLINWYLNSKIMGPQKYLIPQFDEMLL